MTKMVFIYSDAWVKALLSAIGLTLSSTEDHLRAPWTRTVSGTTNCCHFKEQSLGHRLLMHLLDSFQAKPVC